MADLSPLSGEERKSNSEAVRSVDDPNRSFRISAIECEISGRHNLTTWSKPVGLLIAEELAGPRASVA